MRKLIDLTGQRFGRWKVLNRVSNDTHSKTRWLCECACAAKTRKFVEASSLRHGISKSCGCLIREASLARSGPKHPCWKGGRYKRSDGYIRLGRYNGSQLEHRAVMERHLGRKLNLKETIHHKNGIRSDNRLSNLELRYGDHGEGQSIEDLKVWAVEFLKLHAPELLR